jgi:hypothetical protein
VFVERSRFQQKKFVNTTEARTSSFDSIRELVEKKQQQQQQQQQRRRRRRVPTVAGGWPSGRMENHPVILLLH